MARGVHLFDLLRFLTGSEISEVRAFSDAPLDRTTAGIALLKDRIPALITTSKRIPSADNRITIYGSKARLTLRIFPDREKATLEIKSAQGTKTHRFSARDLYIDVLKEFGRSAKRLAQVSDGVAAIQVTEAWRQSARKGKAVRIS